MLYVAMLALGLMAGGNAFAGHKTEDQIGQVFIDKPASPNGLPDRDKIVATKRGDSIGHSVRLAAVDTQDKPLCAADGICNLAVCSAAQDPDCPKDLPAGAGAAPATTSISLETEGCSSTQSKDIRAVAWNLVDDWPNFERSIESATGSNLGNCIRDRFRDNARVVCEQQTNCNNRGCVLGRSSPLNKTTRIFGTFFNNIANAAAPDRRACYAALLMHEFSHSCDRVFEKPRAEAREAAAFTYWRKRFPGTSGWTRTGTNGSGCGLD